MSSLKKRFFSLSAFCALSAAVTCLTPLSSYADLSRSDTRNASKNAGQTRLSFHTEGEIHTQPNLLILHLRAEHSASNPAKAQAELNQIVSRALKNANEGHQSISNLEIQTGDYAVNQISAPDSKPVWNASQEILLKAPVAKDKPKQSEELLHIGGSLQNLGLALQEIEWTLDEKTKKAATDQAVQSALEAIRPEAQNAGKTLGLTFISLESVNIDRPYFQGSVPRPMMMSALNRSADKLPPQSAAHELKISASANAVAIFGHSKAKH